MALVSKVCIYCHDLSSSYNFLPYGIRSKTIVVDSSAEALGPKLVLITASNFKIAVFVQNAAKQNRVLS